MYLYTTARELSSVTRQHDIFNPDRHRRTGLMQRRFRASYRPVATKACFLSSHEQKATLRYGVHPQGIWDHDAVASIAFLFNPETQPWHR